MAARLPVPGSDDGVWGSVLNDFLSVAHDGDGTVKANAVDAGALQDGSVTGTKLQDSSVTSVKLAASGGSDGQVLTKNGGASGGVVWTTPASAADATSSTKGIVQLTGDFGGTATSPTVTATHLAAALPVNQGGTGSTTQNFVDLATTQTVAGAKTFSSTVTAPAFSATGLTGATAGTRLAGATASGAPTTGTWAIGDVVTAQNGAIWVCTTAGSPGTWTKVASGKAWEFDVTTYGATGNGSTDDTAAFQSAINAAVAYAQANSGYAEVVVPVASAYYAINGALVQGGSTYSNAQLTLPVCPVAANKVTLVIKGVENAIGQFHWQQTVPTRTGATLVSNGIFASASAQANSINSFGNPVVLGGPNQSGAGPGTIKYGTSALLFSNMQVVVKGINIQTAVSTSGLNYGAMDFSGLAQANVVDSSWGQATTWANTWSNIANISSLATGLSAGLLMPANGNNDNCLIQNCTIYGGFTRGVFLTEHTVIQKFCVLYCYTALCPVGSYYGSVGAGHVITGDQISAEGFNNLIEVIGPGQSGIGPIMDMQIDTEGAPVFLSNGGGMAAALGTIKLGGLFVTANMVVPTTGLKLIDEKQRPGPAAMPSYTLGTAFLNPFWHDWLVSASGGTVTAYKVGATIGGTSAPTMNTVAGATGGTFLVPAGGWLQIDGTVQPTINQSVLL